MRFAGIVRRDSRHYVWMMVALQAFVDAEGGDGVAALADVHVANTKMCVTDPSLHGASHFF